MKKIAIVDYGLGNVLSIKNALIKVGCTSIISSEPKDIKSCDYLILPGVGAFSAAMDRIAQKNLKNTILTFINSDKPILGICLGFQLLMDSSDENGLCMGLQYLNNEIVKLESSKQHPLPNIGWRTFSNIAKKSKILNGIEDQEFYYLHSYGLKAKGGTDEVANIRYGSNELTTVVENKNIFGVQFHPEKSRDQGLHLLKNFTNL